MYIALHHITEGIIDQPMPLDEGFVLECGRDNVHDKMATAAGGARVSGMFRAFVDDIQRIRLQGLRQTGADPVDAFVGHVREAPF